MDSSIAMPLGPGDPQEIGQFTIIGLLGAGGMGEVYLATAEGGYAAVKRIRPRLVSYERFKREVGILYRVPAGVAPGVLAHDSTAARPWFAADYVPGLTLDEALGLHGPLPLTPCGCCWRSPPHTCGRCTRPGSCTAISSPRTSCSSTMASG